MSMYTILQYKSIHKSLHLYPFIVENWYGMDNMELNVSHLLS